MPLKIISRSITGMLAVLLGMVNCTVDKSPPTKTELIGTYMGRYAGGTEVFEVKADGTFHQEFQAGEGVIYSSNGNWTEAPAGIIIFKPFVSPHCMFSGGTENYPDKRPSSPDCKWGRSPIHIEIGLWPYDVVKIDGEGASYTKETLP